MVRGKPRSALIIATISLVAAITPGATASDEQRGALTSKLPSAATYECGPSTSSPTLFREEVLDAPACAADTSGRLSAGAARDSDPSDDGEESDHTTARHGDREPRRPEAPRRRPGWKPL